MAKPSFMMDKRNMYVLHDRRKSRFKATKGQSLEAQGMMPPSWFWLHCNIVPNAAIFIPIIVSNGSCLFIWMKIKGYMQGLTWMRLSLSPSFGKPNIWGIIMGGPSHTGIIVPTWRTERSSFISAFDVSRIKFAKVSRVSVEYTAFLAAPWYQIQPAVVSYFSLLYTVYPCSMAAYDQRVTLLSGPHIDTAAFIVSVCLDCQIRSVHCSDLKSTGTLRLRSCFQWFIQACRLGNLD